MFLNIFSSFSFLFYISIAILILYKFANHINTDKSFNRLLKLIILDPCIEKIEKYCCINNNRCKKRLIKKSRTQTSN